jgi:hypothetical protein
MIPTGMSQIARRSFLAVAPLAGVNLSAATETVRTNPLDGVQREKLKITDLTVTLLSAPIPPEKQWFNPVTITWKSDAVLVRVFTDQGLIGIGEADPYGGPLEMQRFAADYVKPVLLGQNPFDLPFLAGLWAGPAGVAWKPPAGRSVWGGRRLRVVGPDRQGQRAAGLLPARGRPHTRSAHPPVRQRRR